METVPNISEAEWEVMKVLWGKAPLNASQIIDILNKTETRHPKTIKTLLNRLVKKKALGFEKRGREYLYFPKVKEADCVSEASESFLRRIFGGALQPMFAHFVQQRKMSKKEIQELRRILEEKE